MDAPVDTTAVKRARSQARTGAHNRRRDLTKGPITRTLLAFSLPVLGGNLLASLNGTVNHFFVSQLLGVEAITAVGNANVVMFLMLGASFGVSMAANILIGTSVGAGDMGMVKRVMGTCVTFFAVVAVAVGLIGVLTAPWILAAMGTPGVSREEAAIYLRIVFLAMPFMYFFAFLQMAQRGAGDSRTPFYFMALAVALDMVLNPVLITGFGPVPALGIAGSALSTVLAQAISLGLLILVLYRNDSPLALGRAEAGLLRPDRAILKSLVVKGMPMGLQMLVISGAAMVMIGFVNSYGAVTAAAYTAASQIWTYVQMPAMALGASVSAMAAQNVGAGRWDRVGLVARSGVLSGLIITGSIAAAIVLAGDLTLRLFLPVGSEALSIAHHLNDRAIWAFVLFSVTFALSGVVRSTGAVWAPLLILVVAMYGVRIPFTLVMKPVLGADAIWWSFPLGTATAAILSTAYYLHGGWKRAKMLADAHPVGAAPDVGQAPPTVEAVDSTPPRKLSLTRRAARRLVRLRKAMRR